MSAEALSPTPYQLLPRLTDDEYEALKADIAEHGIRVPIDVDEAGTIIDGHHRAWIAADLGVDCPRRVVAGLSDEAKRSHAIAVNIHRRNLTREQRRELVARLRGEGMSTRRIAEATGLSKGTVGNTLAEVPNAGHLPAAVTGSDGKTYPATRPTATVTRRESTSETVTVDTATGEINPKPAERHRIDVVRVVNLAIKYAEDAAAQADLIRPEHLAARSEEAAVWGRRLSTALDAIQRLDDAFREASA